MKEIQFVAPGKAALVERELPRMNENEVLIKTLYTVVSAGTEKANVLDLPNTAAYGRWPKVEGYAGIGIVEKIGSQVTKVAEGDRVLVYHGTHAQFSIRPETHIYPVKVDVPDEWGPFAVVGAMGLGGLRKTELELGESAMVMGLGLLGIFALQCAVWSGACPVIAADLNPERRALALQLGADYAFDPAEPDFAEQVKAVTDGKGVNAIVEVTGAAVALEQALDCVARQGRIALNGCTRISDCKVDYYRQVHVPGVKLIGAHNMVRPKCESYPHYWTNEADCLALLGLMSKGKIKVDPVLSTVASPEQCEEVYHRLCTDKNFPLGVVFDWKNYKG